MFFGFIYVATLKSDWNSCMVATSFSLSFDGKTRKRNKEEML